MNKTLWKTLGILFVCVNLTGIGVALFVHANLGSDAITVFVDGLHHLFNISYGSASRIYNISVIVLALCLTPKKIGWTTIVYALMVGFFIDLYEPLLAGLSIADFGLILRFISICIGQLCFAISFGLLIYCRKGMNQVDAIATYISEKTTIAFARIRTLLDVVLLVSGWLLGGVVGIGSIFAMCTTGYLVSRVVRILEKG